MSGRLPHHMRLNTPIFIFWIHKVCALISSWKVFSSNFGKQTFLIGTCNSFFNTGLMKEIPMSWHDIIVHVLVWNFNQLMKLWVNGIAKILRNQNRMNSREQMLISLLLYPQFKFNINLDRMFWLYSLYSMDQLICGRVASCPSQRPLLSGLG